MRWPSSRLMAAQMSALSAPASKSSAKVGSSPADEQLLGRQRADLRTLLGVEQRELDRLRAVHVRVEAAVQQVDGLEVDGERAVGAPRQQLLGHRHGVVVRDQDRGGHALARPERLHQVGLLVQRVVVVGRLVGGAEAEEVRHQQRVPLGERRARPSPSRATSSGSRAAASSAAPRPCGGRRACRPRRAPTRSPSAHQLWITAVIDSSTSFSRGKPRSRFCWVLRAISGCSRRSAPPGRPVTEKARRGSRRRARGPRRRAWWGTGRRCSRSSRGSAGRAPRSARRTGSRGPSSAARAEGAAHPDRLGGGELLAVHAVVPLGRFRASAMKAKTSSRGRATTTSTRLVNTRGAYPVASGFRSRDAALS